MEEKLGDVINNS